MSLGISTSCFKYRDRIRLLLLLLFDHKFHPPILLSSGWIIGAIGFGVCYSWLRFAKSFCRHPITCNLTLCDQPLFHRICPTIGKRSYYQTHQRGLLADLIQREIKDDRRILCQDEFAIAFVPICARYPYEVWIAPIQSVANCSDLSSEQRSSLAKALKTVTLKFDGLWSRPFPYLIHAEFYPPYRTSDRLKYLAGTELAAGMFANDALPEEKAKELQAVLVTLEESV